MKQYYHVLKFIESETLLSSSLDHKPVYFCVASSAIKAVPLKDLRHRADMLNSISTDMFSD